MAAAAMQNDRIIPKSNSSITATSKNQQQHDQDRRDACTCCPYGYHIVVPMDMVQHATDDARSGLSSQHQHDSYVEENDRIGQPNRKSVYENVPRSPSTGNRRVDDFPDASPMGKTIKTTGLSIGTGGSAKLENQYLFTDSLENVMSDFEETLNRGGSSGARKQKDYSSDYEMSKANALGKKPTGTEATTALDAFHHSRSLKAGAGRTDGYTSDCGYAVPSGTTNRPTTLRFVTKPTTCGGDSNHYYASPNTQRAMTTPPKLGIEYATGDATGARPSTTSALSDSLSDLSSPSSTTQNVNGGISTTAHESRSSNHSRPSFENSYYSQSRATPPMSALLSPRLLASSPLPPKPSLGVSGRVGMQIEQLASHLNATSPITTTSDYGRERHGTQREDPREVSPTRRILELESRIRAIPGPALGGEKRRLQDELNRLIKEEKRAGYQRAITPTVLDTSGGGYATALARAMSSVATSDGQHQYSRSSSPFAPEPPPRRESVTRMKISSVPPSPIASRARTHSANGPTTGNGSLNLGAFHSFRRTTNPLSHTSSGSSNATTSTIVQPSNGRSASACGGRDEHDCVSDSEYALGNRGLDRFGALRRSKHLLSRPQSALPPAAMENKQQPKPDHHQLVNEWKKEMQEKTIVVVGNDQSKPINQTVNGGDHRSAINCTQEKPKPFMRSIGILTDTAKPVQKINMSTCTSPLPQPKPCTDCYNLRQQVMQLSTKPLTFNRGASTEECLCSPCQDRLRLKFASIGCGTSIQDIQKYRRDASSTAEISIPCDDCEQRNSIIRVSFGTSTERRNDGVDTGSNTEFVEIRNRHVNTDPPTVRNSETNTDQPERRTVDSMVDKKMLQSCGGYRSITSNTTPPLMITFGVNTDSGGSWTLPSQSINTIGTRDVETLTDEQSKLEPAIIVEKSTANASVGTEFVAKAVKMIDKYVDSTVRTRDMGTRTPPPPPPPLQPLRSSYCQTINEPRTMVSVGIGDCTLELNECDLCKSGISEKSNGWEAGTQTDSSSEELDKTSIACGSDEAMLTDQHHLPRAEDTALDSVHQQPVELQRQSSYVDSAVRHEHKEQLTVSMKSPGSDSGNDQKSQRGGIQRVFSPKSESVKDLDPAMWTSQTSAASDLSSDRGAELTEESIVVCPLDDDEEKSERSFVEEDSKQHGRKIDFTKPRQTRAFALSKAAAAKKLLTSDTVQGHQRGTVVNTANGKQHQQSVQSFQRTSIQSKSVRLDSKKGDSLAYITDKKQFQQAPSTSGSAAEKSKNNPVQPTSSGLKGKVAIKKSPVVRKTTPSPARSSLASTAPSRFTRPLPYQRRTSSLPGGNGMFSSSQSSSSKDEEAAAEAEDIVGPLPSEVAAAVAASRNYRSTESACYTNPMAVNGDDDDHLEQDERPMMDSGMKKLVGNVVENLPTTVEQNGDKERSTSDDGLSADESDSSAHGDDSEESLDEGSYDTNGNISTICDVTPNNTTVVEEIGNGDAGAGVSQKFELSPQLREACDTLNSNLTTGKNPSGDEQLEWAQKFLQHEWLKTSASKRANPGHVGDFLDILEDYSPQLLRHVVNFCDQNENTALHYAVSRGHFDIVSLLLDTKMCNLNKPNKAGYTPVMLASLCPISSDTDSMVIQRLFQMGDVNIKASQHGQTALMLAVSHGNLETAKLLLEAGAGVNIQDEEGSTALMCAAEHGHKEIVRLLLAHPEIDASKTDNDRSTALSIAVENDHKDIGVLIYAHLNYGRPPPSLQSKSAPVWC